MICTICGANATFLVDHVPMCEECTDDAVETAIDMCEGELLYITPIEEADNDDEDDAK